MNSRAKNIAWTVSTNYLQDIDLNIYSNPIENKYKSAILGMCYRIYYMDDVIKFLRLHFHNKSNKAEILTIAELTMENATRDITFKEFPGTLDFEKEYVDDLVYKSTLKSAKNLSEELVNGYYRILRGKVAITNKIGNSLLNDIINFKSQDTEELIKFLSSTFEKYFHIYKTLPINDEVEKIVEEVVKKKTLNIQNIQTSNVNFIGLEELEKYTIESAEFTSSIYDDLKVVMEKKATSGSDFNRTKSIVQKHYGENYLNENSLSILENHVCYGIHEGVRLYFTKGEFKNSSYYKTLSEDTYSENLEEYKKDELHYKRAVTNLQEVIKNSILKDSEEYEIFSDSGNIIPSNIWKLKTSDNKIFKRVNKDYKGDITIDILLDSSASQKERQSIVAIEGFIIAEALTKLNVKTRVFGFNNFFNYMVLRKFRDYTDPVSSNKEIFKYHSSGSNRDGLAIRLMTELIEKNSSDRKILIVLSDGKPNDELNLGLIDMADMGVKDYKDDLAITDSHNNVQIAKAKGIDVLGVFTGKEEDLKAVQNIYNRDFAYITDIKRFHSIVGIFLKSIANKLY